MIMNETKSVSHNACSVSHYNVSYWIQIDRGDFPVTDVVGEFSIIDSSFQVETYGTHLESDRSLLKNYATRRCFVEFLNYLPSHYEGRSVSFAVLYQDFPHDHNRNYLLHCRCIFGSSPSPYCGDLDLRPVDFDLSLTFENVKANKTNERKTNENRN